MSCPAGTTGHKGDCCLHAFCGGLATARKPQLGSDCCGQSRWGRHFHSKITPWPRPIHLDVFAKTPPLRKSSCGSVTSVTRTAEACSKDLTATQSDHRKCVRSLLSVAMPCTALLRRPMTDSTLVNVPTSAVLCVLINNRYVCCERQQLMHISQHYFTCLQAWRTW